MSMIATEEFSLENASKPEVRALLASIVDDTALAYIQLAVNKGDRPQGVLATLVGNASIAAQGNYVAALQDLLFTHLDQYTANPTSTERRMRVLRALELAESAAATGLPVQRNALRKKCRDLAHLRQVDVTNAIARLLSYEASIDAVAAVNSMLQIERSLTVAAYLLITRLRVDVLTALDFDFEFRGIQSSDIEGAPEFMLAVQEAIWAMFSRDGPLAKSKLVEIAGNWSGDLQRFLLELLAEERFSSNAWARETSTAILRDPPSGEASGISRRVVERGRLQWYAGYTMEAAYEGGRCEEYQDPWMYALADRITALVQSRVNGASIGPPSLSKWPDETFQQIFKRLQLASGQALGIQNCAELCCEMFYASETRSPVYRIVEVGQLSSFSIVYDERNETVSGYFNPGKFKIPDLSFDAVLSRLKAASLASAASSQTIFTPIYTIAAQIVEDKVSSQRWNADGIRIYDRASSLFTHLKSDRSTSVVVCDNVTANDLVASQKTHDLRLRASRIRYPSPVTIGLAYDATDPLWGDILREAWTAVVIDSNPEVRKSLRKVIDQIIALNGRPVGALAKAFPTEHVNADT